MRVRLASPLNIVGIGAVREAIPPEAAMFEVLARVSSIIVLIGSWIAQISVFVSVLPVTGQETIGDQMSSSIRLPIESASLERLPNSVVSAFGFIGGRESGFTQTVMIELCFDGTTYCVSTGFRRVENRSILEILLDSPQITALNGFRSFCGKPEIAFRASELVPVCINVGIDDISGVFVFLRSGKNNAIGEGFHISLGGLHGDGVGGGAPSFPLAPPSFSHFA